MEKAPPQKSGELTAQEQASLETLVKLCYEKKLIDKPVVLHQRDLETGLDDGTTLLRFLRGNLCNVDGALRQYEEALAIRRSVQEAAAYDNIDIHSFEETRKMYPHWLGSRDKAGLPICVMDIVHLDHAIVEEYAASKSMSNPADSTTASEATSRALAFHDYLTRFVLPLCSSMRDRPNPETPITSSIYVVDIGSFTFKQAWSLRGFAQDISHLLATCFPEVIERVYALNASPYFVKIWGFLSRWIEPRTASKVVLVPSADVLKTLESTIDVENIPIQYGGKCDYKHAMLPSLDEGLLRFLTWSSPADKLPIGPIEWTVNEDRGKTLVAVGTAGGEKRREHICTAGS